MRTKVPKMKLKFTLIWKNRKIPKRGSPKTRVGRIKRGHRRPTTRVNEVRYCRYRWRSLITDIVAKPDKKYLMEYNSQ